MLMPPWIAGRSLVHASGTPRVCDQPAILLHRIQCRVCFAQELLNRISVLGIHGDTHADGKLWSIAVISNSFADASCHQVGLLRVGFRQDHSKLVPAEARRSINGPAAATQNI